MFAKIFAKGFTKIFTKIPTKIPTKILTQILQARSVRACVTDMIHKNVRGMALWAPPLRRFWYLMFSQFVEPW